MEPEAARRAEESFLDLAYAGCWEVGTTVHRIGGLGPAKLAETAPR